MKKYFAKYITVEENIIKLFLCSKDIQIGDQFYWRDQLSNNLWTKEYAQDKKNHEEFDSVTFKIVGEISPKAIWIKEGDEFDDYEEWYFSEATNHFIMKKLPNDKIQWQLKEPSTKLKVKCSQCNTFH